MNIRKRGKRWVARRHFEKGFATRREAERFALILDSSIADAIRKHDAAERPCCRIRDKVTEYLADSKTGMGRKPCAQKTLELHKKRLLTFDAAFHSKPLDCITREEVAGWMQRRLKVGKHGQPLDPGTVNTDMVSLRSFARWAQAKGYAPPALAFMVVPKLQRKGMVGGTNRKPPKAREMGEMLRMIAMVKEVRPDAGLLLEGMVLFCLRPHGLCSLRRSDLKLPKNGEPGRLRCIGLKGLYERELPIFPESEQLAWAESCIELFAATRGRPPRAHEPLIVCRNGRSKVNPGGWTTGTLDNTVRRLCGKLGIQFIPYQIRHSTISWLHQNPGMSPAATQVAAAHASITTQDIYGKRRGGEAIPAYNALSVLMGRYRQTTEKVGGKEGGISSV